MLCGATIGGATVLGNLLFQRIISSVLFSLREQRDQTNMIEFCLLRGNFLTFKVYLKVKKLI